MQCAMCKKEFIRCGNNPYPVKQENNERRKINV